jgi:hypothetical protein
MISSWVQAEVRFTDSLEWDDKSRISKDVKSFLLPIREKLRTFELELKDR